MNEKSNELPAYSPKANEDGRDGIWEANVSLVYDMLNSIHTVVTEHDVCTNAEFLEALARMTATVEDEEKDDSNEGDECRG